MANLKNITDLPIAESAEGINLIVNDNGSAKQLDPKFLGGGVVPLFVTVNGDKISHTYEQLSEAISKGIPIFISAVWSLDNDYPEGVPVYWNSYTLYKNEGIITFHDYNGGTEMCRMLSDNSIQWNRA